MTKGGQMPDEGSPGSRIHEFAPQDRAAVLRHLRAETRQQGKQAPPELSVEQRQLWSLHILQAGDRMNYNVAWRIDLYGALDINALANAISDVVREQPTLQTGYRSDEGRAVAFAFAPDDAQLRLQVQHVGSTGTPTHEVAMTRCRDEATTRFDLAHEPPFRARLLVLDARHHVLMLTLHEIAADALSRDAVVSGLVAAYRARTGGWPQPPGAAPEAAYARYAAEQQRWLDSPEAAGMLARWKDLMQGFDGTELPFEDVYSLYDTWLTSHGEVISRALPPPLVQRVDRFCHTRGVPVLTVLRTAHAALLHRYNRQTDIVIGLRTDNRPTGSAGVIGNYENIVPARLDLTGPPTFVALLDQVAQQDAVAAGLARTPYPLIADAIDDRPLSDRIPLLMTAVHHDPAPPVREIVPGLRLTCQRIHDRTARLDLTLEFAWAHGAATVQVEYASTLLTRESTEYLLDRFEILLEALVTDPEQPIDRPPLTTAGERRRVTAVWNPPLPPVEPGTLTERFAAQVARAPRRVAVQDEAGTTLTYADLDRRSDQLAWYLREQRVRPDSLCAILTQRSAALVVAILGVLKAGAAFLPIDHQLTPAGRTATILTDAKAVAVITEDALAARIPPDQPVVVRLDGDARRIASATPPRRPVAVSGQHLAYAMYTSGSSGTPKGVLIEHRSVTAFTDAAVALYDLTEDSQFLQFASVSFDVLTFDVFAALLIGATLHVADDDTRGSLDRLRDLLRERRISVLMSTPVVLQLLDPEDFPDLRVLAVGGEPFSGSFTTRWARGRRFVNSYGPTEATCGVITKECTGREWRASPPIGQVMDNHRAYVLDEHLRPVPVGVVGDLFVEGIGLARGYQGQPGLTASAFVPNPFATSPGARMYRTGDLACWTPQGDLRYLGRSDQQVKVRGMRVELGEIEEALRRHEGVKQAVVLATVGADSGTKLTAYVVRNDQRFGTAELRSQLVPWLPPSMVPGEFVFVPSIPLTGGGKIDQRALQAIADSGEVEAPDREVGASRTPTERTVAAIIEPILGIGPVGPDENFFELGGHSLHILQILGQLRSGLGVEIRVGEFFSVPTIAGLAALVDEASRTAGGAPTLSLGD